jgi:hypothetical protein
MKHLAGQCLGWVAALGLALTAAQAGLAQPLPALLQLPPVPALRLALPAPSGQSGWVHPESAPWLAYTSAVVPREWRDVPDEDLRLQLETGRVNLGRLSLTGEISTAPGRERDCPDCRGAAWSSALRLKYHTGDLGPLRDTGPELLVGGSPARAGVKAEGLLRGVFSGKF